MIVIILGTVLGMAWFTSGILGPLVSCATCGKFTTEDYVMIPISGLLGPFALIGFLLAYERKKRLFIMERVGVKEQKGKR